MIFLGIDPGIRPAVAMLRPVDPVFFRIEHHWIDMPQLDNWLNDLNRLLKLEYYFVRIIKEMGLLEIEKVVAIESLAYSKIYRASTMAKVEFILQSACVKGKVGNIESLYMVAPGTWKKFIAGNGRAKKDRVRRVLEEKYGPIPGKPEEFDYSDALAICLTGKDRYEKEQQKKDS